MVLKSRVTTQYPQKTRSRAASSRLYVFGGFDVVVMFKPIFIRQKFPHGDGTYRSCRC